MLEAGDEALVGAVAKVYEWRLPEDYVNYCAGTEVSDWRSPTRIEGCDVTLRCDGSQFVEGTAEGTCESALYDEDYTTSDVTLTDTYLESWDCGWHADGTQVWGASGGPDHVERLTPLGD